MIFNKTLPILLIMCSSADLRIDTYSQLLELADVKIGAPSVDAYTHSAFLQTYISERTSNLDLFISWLIFSYILTYFFYEVLESLAPSTSLKPWSTTLLATNNGNMS